MSYTTQYGKCRFDTHKKPKKKLVIKMLFVFTLLVFILQFVFPAQVLRFRKTVFPFLEPHVQQSFAKMSKSIYYGTSFEDAAAVFCREILQDGKD